MTRLPPFRGRPDLQGEYRQGHIVDIAEMAGAEAEGLEGFPGVSRLPEHGQKELVDMVRDCRHLIEKAGSASPDRAVIVDEAQDFGNEAFKLIRAIVPVEPNDLFIVGDAHQRIYRQEGSLGKCGIDIKPSKPGFVGIPGV